MLRACWQAAPPCHHSACNCRVRSRLQGACADGLQGGVRLVSTAQRQLESRELEPGIAFSHPVQTARVQLMLRWAMLTAAHQAHARPYGVHLPTQQDQMCLQQTDFLKLTLVLRMAGGGAAGACSNRLSSDLVANFVTPRPPPVFFLAPPTVLGFLAWDAPAPAIP